MIISQGFCNDLRDSNITILTYMPRIQVAENSWKWRYLRSLIARPSADIQASQDAVIDELEGCPRQVVQHPRNMI